MCVPPPLQAAVKDLAEAMNDYLMREVSGLAIGSARERMKQALTTHADIIKERMD
jgi:hypothetical protein